MNDEVEIGSIPRFINGVEMSAMYWAKVPLEEYEVRDFQTAVAQFGIEVIMWWGVTTALRKMDVDEYMRHDPRVQLVDTGGPIWLTVRAKDNGNHEMHGNCSCIAKRYLDAIERSEEIRDKERTIPKRKNDDGHIPDSPYLKTERGAVALTKLATIAYEIAAPSGSKRPKSSQKIAKIVEQMNKNGARPASVSSWTHYCVDRILSKYLPPFSNGSPSREEAKAILDSPLRPIPKAQALYRLRKNGGKA